MIKPDDEHLLAYVDAYLHGALDARESKKVADHCEACPICRVALEEAYQRQEALQSLPPVEASEALIRQTLDRVDRHRKSQVWWTRAGLIVAAAVLLPLTAAHLYFYTLTASTLDLRVMGQAELLAGSQASLRVLLRDAPNGSPRAGVPVEIDLLGPDQTVVHLARFTTDRNGSGTPRLQVPDGASGQYKLRVTARPGGTAETIEQTVQLRRSWQLMLTSDKPVYQPGQVIRLRSIVLARPRGKPVAGQEAVYAITDPKGNVVFRRREATSRFGISAVDCPLADEITEGPYQLACTVGDTTSTITVDVKKYVLPKFKIDLKLDEPFYEPEQKIRGTLSARYFFGKPVKNALMRVDIRVPDGLSSGKDEAIATAAARTDADGNAAFSMVLPPSFVGRPQDGGDARFLLTATVQDSAGQRHSASLSRLVTRQPIRVEVIPEAGALVRGMANKVYFVTTYADGRPAETRISVAGIAEEIRTNSLGAASIDFTPMADKVSWLVSARDAAGAAGRREVTVDAQGSDGRFLLRTDRAVYNGGQTIRVTALGGGKEPVFLDVIKDGQTMLTDAIGMTNGQGEYQIDLPPTLSGTLQICAYRFGKQNLPLMQTRVIHVRPAGGLKVDARVERPEYRPGQQAKLSLAITDREGKPVPGALSLAAVDEAVYSVLGQAVGMQPVFSALEQELLKPVYAIYPWSPDFGRMLPPDECNQLETALFARAGQETRTPDRDTILTEIIRRFGANSQEILRVLDRPDWEELAERIPGLKKYIPLLQDRNSAYSLRDSTYPRKHYETERLRKERLEKIVAIWWIIGITGGIALVVQLVRTLFCTSVEALVVVAIIVLLIGLLMPAVNAARESGRRAIALNDLHQLGMALEEAEEKDALGEWGIGRERAGNEAPDNRPAAPRVRQWFPETLLWRPEVITDDAGRASVTIDLADSITTWRLSAGAISADGKLGGGDLPVRVFQPFFVDVNLPVSLTRGDEISIPAVVYNYLNKPLSVELRLDEAAWFERLDPAAKKLDLAASEVRSVGFRVRVRKVGRHELTVHAAGGEAADAIKRAIEVVPDGRRVERTLSGTLQRPVEIPWNIPADATEGSVRAVLRIYPSTFSQLVDGLEGIFQQPYGCFEQTSSTTYPNVLALDYLRRTKKSVPQVEAKARQYIHLGYQRLLSFEIPGGGFDWFGNPPANCTLTAYGLMEFRDMARVHDIDPALIARTRQWLLARQNADGSWTPRGHAMHEDPTLSGGDLSRLSTTAYIAWAVAGDRSFDAANARLAGEYLLRHDPAVIDDPYVLALVANALLAIHGDGLLARPYLERLESLARHAPDGKLTWWEMGANRRTLYYGGGASGNIEATAMATMALIEGHRNPGTIRSALSWLLTQKDARGTWHSTQATVLALKALLAGTDRPLGDARPRQVAIAVDGKPVHSLTIAADQGEVMQQVDLSRWITPGSRRITVAEPSGTGSGYQATFVYYMPGQKPAAGHDALSIQLDYDKTRLVVDDRVTVHATAVNRAPHVAPMVILDLPLPAGFALDTSDFDGMLADGRIAKYQTTPRGVTVYLRSLEPSVPLHLRYGLRATTPVKLTAPSARVYEYYRSDRLAETDATEFRVEADPRTK